MEKREAGSDQGKELARTVIVAASSLIPAAGGVVSLFLDKYLPSALEERKQAFLEKLAGDLERMPEEIVAGLATNAEYHSIIVKVLRAVLEEDQEIKINAFRNILINAALPIHEANREKEFYIKLLSNLTSDQIRILQLFYQKDRQGSICFSSVNTYISEQWREVDASYRFALVTELVRYGLFSGSRAVQEKRGEGEHLTDFGERFINFIFDPVKTARV